MSEQEDEPIIKSWSAGSSKKKEDDDLQVSVAKPQGGGGSGRNLIIGFAVPVVLFLILGVGFTIFKKKAAGAKDPEFVKVLADSKGAIASCLVDARKNNPDLAGTVEVSASVDKTGKATETFISRKGGDPTELFPTADLQSCVEGAMGKLSWRKARDEKRLASVKVEVPALSGDPLPADQIQPAVDGIKSNMLICFQVPDVAEAVKVSVKMNVTASGRVHKPEVASPAEMRDSKFERCINQELKNLSFPESGKGAAGFAFELDVPAFDPYKGQEPLLPPAFAAAVNAALKASGSAVTVAPNKNGFAVRCPGAKTTLPRTFSPLTEGSAKSFAQNVMADCEDAASQAMLDGEVKKLSRELAGIAKKIRKTAKPKGCKKAAHCAIAYVGAAPCKPKKVVAFSRKATNAGRLSFFLASYAKKESEIFDLKGEVPECDLAPPNAKCSAGKCIASAKGAPVKLIDELTAEATEYFASLEPKILSCATKTKSKFKGDLVITATVGKDSRVAKATFLKPAKSVKQAASLKKCVAKALKSKKVRFPGPYGSITKTFTIQ